MKPCSTDQVGLVEMGTRLNVDAERPERVTECVQMPFDAVPHFRTSADAAANQNPFRIETELEIVDADRVPAIESF